MRGEDDDTGFLTRRSVLRAGLAIAAGAASLPASAQAAIGPGRVLSFRHLHTDERLTLSYRQGDRYLPAALGRIDKLMRDFRTGDVRRIDPQLLDFLYDVRRMLGTEAPFEIISAYRSPATNDALAAKSSAVSFNSLHKDGMAIDVRVPGRQLVDLRDAAIKLKRGGVGFYPKDRFVHLDVGRVRRW
ncbi:MAG TPA: DUF882 domain-containing protein [Alphaproteobacteria bacterium]